MDSLLYPHDLHAAWNMVASQSVFTDASILNISTWKPVIHIYMVDPQTT